MKRYKLYNFIVLFMALATLPIQIRAIKDGTYVGLTILLDIEYIVALFYLNVFNNYLVEEKNIKQGGLNEIQDNDENNEEYVLVLNMYKKISKEEDCEKIINKLKEDEDDKIEK